MTGQATAAPQGFNPEIGRRRRERIRQIKGLLFSSPFWLGILLFTAFPMVASIYFSLSHYSGLEAPVFRGLGNYVDMFHDPALLKALGNTFLYAGLSIPLNTLLGLLVAHHCSTRKFGDSRGGAPSSICRRSCLRWHTPSCGSGC